MEISVTLRTTLEFNNLDDFEEAINIVVCDMTPDEIIELQHLANMNKASQSLPVMYITVVGTLPPNIVTLLKAHEFQVFEERYIKNNSPHFRTYISWDYDWSNLEDKLNIHSYIIEK